MSPRGLVTQRLRASARDSSRSFPTDVNPGAFFKLWRKENLAQSRRGAESTTRLGAMSPSGFPVWLSTGWRIPLMGLG